MIDAQWPPVSWYTVKGLNFSCSINGPRGIRGLLLGTSREWEALVPWGRPSLLGFRDSHALPRLARSTCQILFFLTAVHTGEAWLLSAGIALTVHSDPQMAKQNRAHRARAECECQSWSQAGKG